MTVITARRYIHGRPSDHALTIDGSPRTPLEHGSFDWIGLCEPDEEEMARLAAQFGLHPLAVEDALNPRQLPKADIGLACHSSPHFGGAVLYSAEEL